VYHRPRRRQRHGKGRPILPCAIPLAADNNGVSSAQGDVTSKEDTPTGLVEADLGQTRWSASQDPAARAGPAWSATGVTGRSGLPRPHDASACCPPVSTSSRHYASSRLRSAPIIGSHPMSAIPDWTCPHPSASQPNTNSDRLRRDHNAPAERVPHPSLLPASNRCQSLLTILSRPNQEQHRRFRAGDQPTRNPPRQPVPTCRPRRQRNPSARAT
jgi:hypothetical protein